MWCGKAEDAGGLTPAKDDNAVLAAFYPPNFTDFRVCRLYTGHYRQTCVKHKRNAVSRKSFLLILFFFKV